MTRRAHTGAREPALTATTGGRVAKLFIPSPSPCSPVNTTGVLHPESVNTDGGGRP